MFHVQRLLRIISDLVSVILSTMRQRLEALEKLEGVAVPVFCNSSRIVIRMCARPRCSRCTRTQSTEMKCSYVFHALNPRFLKEDVLRLEYEQVTCT